MYRAAERRPVIQRNLPRALADAEAGLALPNAAVGIDEVVMQVGHAVEAGRRGEGEAAAIGAHRHRALGRVGVQVLDVQAGRVVHVRGVFEQVGNQVGLRPVGSGACLAAESVTGSCLLPFPDRRPRDRHLERTAGD